MESNQVMSSGSTSSTVSPAESVTKLNAHQKVKCHLASLSALGYFRRKRQLSEHELMRRGVFEEGVSSAGPRIIGRSLCSTPASSLAQSQESLPSDEPYNRTRWWQVHPRRNRTLRWLCLLYCCFASTLCGSVFSFGVYHDALKTRFNYSEHILQSLSSVQHLGFSVVYPAHFVYQRLGPHMNGICSLFVVSGALLVTYRGWQEPDKYIDHPEPILMYSLFTGFGFSFLYFTAMELTRENFHPSYRDRSTSVIDSFISFGVTIYPLIYTVAFRRGHTNDPGLQDFGGYVIFWGVSVIAISTLGFVCFRKFSYKNDPTGEEEASLIKRDIINVNEPVFEDGPMLPTSWPFSTSMHRCLSTSGPESWTDWKQCNWHLLLWTVALYVAQHLVVAYNFGTYARSSHFASHTGALLTVNGLVQLLTKVPSALISDFTKIHFPRVVLVFAQLCLHQVVLVVLVFLVDDLLFLYTVSVSDGLTTGLVLSLTPRILCEEFSEKYASRNWNLMYFCAAILAVLAQQAFAFGYTHHIDNTVSATYCYGNDCCTTGSVLANAFNFLAIVCTGVLLFRQLRRNDSRSC